MSLESIAKFVTGIVIGAALAGNLGTLKRWVYIQTAKVLCESRASNWPSVKFWPENRTKKSKPTTKAKEAQPQRKSNHSD